MGKKVKGHIDLQARKHGLLQPRQVAPNSMEDEVTMGMGKVRGQFDLQARKHGLLQPSLVASNNMEDESTMGKVKGQIDFEARKTGSLEPDMHRPKVENVLFWRATRCVFAKTCSKSQKPQ